MDDGNTPKLVANELLSYIFYYYDSDDLDALRESTDQFYSCDAVSRAKDVLWEHYSNELPAKKHRINKGNKSIKVKNLDDIMEAVKHLDENVDNLPVQFCALQLGNIPPRTASQKTDEVGDRVTALELQLTELMDEKESRGTNRPNSSFRDALVNGINNAGTGDRHNQQDRQGGHDNGQRRGLAGNNYRNEGSGGNSEYDWKTKRYKSRRRPAEYGERNDSDNNGDDGDVSNDSMVIKGATRGYELVVHNLDTGVTDDNVKDYVIKGKCTVLEIERLSQPDWDTQSFRVKCLMKEKDIIMQRKFWPVDVGFRPYFRRRVVRPKGQLNNNT